MVLMSFFVIYLVLAEPNSPLSVCCNARRRSIVSAKACRDLPEGEKESQDFVPFCLPSDTSLSLPPRLCRSLSAFLKKCSHKKRTILASFLSSLTFRISMIFAKLRLRTPSSSREESDKVCLTWRTVVVGQCGIQPSRG